MAEFPTTTVSTEPSEYSETEGKKLSKWCFELTEHAGNARKKVTSEDNWDSDFEFIRGVQWSGPLPSYRRAIVMNAWKRALHIALAVIIGNRPILKLVPEGNIPPQILKPWQDAFWSMQKREYFIEKYTDTLCWAWLEDGGWMKIGYGKRDELGDSLSDVLVNSPHPKKVFPDPDCTDYRLIDCGYVSYKDTLDLSTVSKRYPDQARLVVPEKSVSMGWGEDSPAWSKSKGVDSIAPAGNWQPTGDYRRAKATIIELSIDDSTPRLETEKEIVNIEEMIGAWGGISKRTNGSLSPTEGSNLEGRIKGLKRSSKIEDVNDIRLKMHGLGQPDVVPEVRDTKFWVPKYPRGRLITCTNEVVLRDIPNPSGAAFGYELRYPYVYFPGAISPNCLFRCGLLSNQKEMQISINKSLSLLVENSIKVTNAFVIA